MDEQDELDYLDGIGMSCPVRPGSPIRPVRPCPIEDKLAPIFGCKYFLS